LLLEIINDNSQFAEGSPSFIPRSIKERVTDLGGHVSVEERAGGCTAVAVTIPI
jgi:signal transduction histidine kinase